MPPMFEIHLKGALITCVGFLAGSLGVFVVCCRYIPFSRFALKFNRFVEHTECHRLTVIFPTLGTQAHFYRRREGRPHAKTTTFIP